MSKIDQLKREIERLLDEELAELFRWLLEKDWERWDEQIEAAGEGGRLDFLVREARAPAGDGFKYCVHLRTENPFVSA